MTITTPTIDRMDVREKLDALVRDAESKREAYQSALSALHQTPGWTGPEFGKSGFVARCGRTSLPVLVGDEVVRDDITGEVFLRAALHLPPRPVGLTAEKSKA
jgi:hypothetical protein